ncbi:hypothetical protein ACTU45_35970 [Streptomyces sp. 24-1644]|uniref:hypothetical protein n=1 Tax=Streptomyces sp. 24-1644 TaxID=3457315 RepID=UPI003FA7A4EB
MPTPRMRGRPPPVHHTPLSHHNHAVQTWAVHAYLHRLSKDARHPDVPAARRRERARIRSEKGIRWADLG